MQKIKCPNCGKEIDIENLIQAGAKEALDKELNAQKKEYEKLLEKIRKDFESSKENAEKEREIAVNNALKIQKENFKRQEEKIKKEAVEEQKEAYLALEEELKEKSNKLKELNRLKVEKTRLEREKEEIEETLSAQFEEKLSQKLAEQKQNQKQKAEEKYELQLKELQKQLDDQKKLTEEMKARQEQGSMQLQGEVQELAIEEYLRKNFKFDNIEEVGKGDMGADSLQTVNTMSKQNCGKIYYESKRTKTFKEDWIAKFKKDIQESGADIGVLVTAIYPKDMTRMGLKDGVYICSYEEFKALSCILRESIIRLNEVKDQQENKLEKSTLLYNYLTSTEFRFQFETIVNAFVTMQSDLDAEKRAMNKLWKKREKEIENVISATTNMYGSIQGIAGSAIKPVKQLDMPLLEVSEI